jgi:uncharacterized membrane protein YsdA (DUF1294 family)
MSRRQSHYSRSTAATGFTLTVLVAIVLLIFPALAIYRQKFDLRWAVGYAIFINLLTYYAYARDKRCAEQSRWRVPEMRLHLLELTGGWPAAFLAQNILRHKSSKVGYQIVFWLIVLAWQLVAFDALQNWKWLKGPY